MGRFNVAIGTTDSWVDTEPVLQVGIGADAGSLVDAMTVLKNGNVGIGSTQATATLDVIGSGNVSGNFAVGGNIGVGTTVPSVALDVTGSIRSSEGNAGHVICWKTDLALGYCSDAPGADGTCTCN